MRGIASPREGSSAMAVKASLKYLRVSPPKVRLVAELISGKQLDEALQLMKFTRRKAAMPIYKLLKSAEANADNMGTVDIDNLYVKNIMVNQGPTLKRIMPRAMGRASLIRKRTSHITVILDER